MNGRSKRKLAGVRAVLILQCASTAEMKAATAAAIRNSKMAAAARERRMRLIHEWTELQPSATGRSRLPERKRRMRRQDASVHDREAEHRSGGKKVRKPRTLARRGAAARQDFLMELWLHGQSQQARAFARSLSD